jgi:hypothetical protein
VAEESIADLYAEVTEGWSLEQREAALEKFLDRVVNLLVKVHYGHTRKLKRLRKSITRINCN